MDFILMDGGRGNRQVKPRRQDYPLWGMEEPRRVWNAHSLYRYGDARLWCRYIVKPREGKYMWMGLTVGDVVTALGVAAIMAPLVLLWIDFIGLGFDGYLSSVGY